MEIFDVILEKRTNFIFERQERRGVLFSSNDNEIKKNGRIFNLKGKYLNLNGRFFKLKGRIWNLKGGILNLKGRDGTSKAGFKI